MDEMQKRALAAFSQGQMSALELRRRLGGKTYSEILGLFGEYDYPLPRAPVAGCEEQIRRADSWMLAPIVFFVDKAPIR